jgi:hypothetical protein
MSNIKKAILCEKKLVKSGCCYMRRVVATACDTVTIEQ